MKIILISLLSFLIVSPCWAGNGNGGGPVNSPINTNSFFNISLSAENARVIGLFVSNCKRESCIVGLNSLRLNLREKAKPQMLCSDMVCSPLERDIVTVGVGASVGTAFGLSGGYAGVADAEVHWQLDVGGDGGLEFDVTGPMKIKPKNGSDFQSGGNILSESGFGSTMFSQYVMMATKRFFGVSGLVRFYGEKSPDTELLAGAMGRDGIPVCFDESGIAVICPPDVTEQLNLLCNDQSRCLDSPAYNQLNAAGLNSVNEKRFGGFDQEELNEAMDEARDIVAMLKENVKNRAIATRLSDVKNMLGQLKSKDLRQSVRDELQDSIAMELEEALNIVASNTRFSEVDLARVEQLPDAQDITEAVAELLNPLLATSGETASETSAKTKARFCATNLGQRRVFDRYCGR